MIAERREGGRGDRWRINSTMENKKVSLARETKKFGKGVLIKRPVFSNLLSSTT